VSHQLQTTAKNGEITGPETKEAPNTLSLLTPSRSPAHSNNNHKKKRHKKQPPKALQFTDVYELVGDELGRGAYSSVATCRRINDGKEFAVKIVPMDKPGVREKVLREIEILYLCRNNRNILQLIQPFEEENQFLLVFEKMHGGL
jgi:MAP kinase interacting serine/threonine kinase